MAPSSHCCIAQPHDYLNSAAFKWTKVDQGKQKDEVIEALKREITALSGQNAELVQILQRHAGECPRLQASLNAFYDGPNSDETGAVTTEERN